MAIDVLIDYEKLVADYLQSLTTVLRGFHSGSGESFLETWVYDDDDTKSILGLVEAAKDAALPSVTIRLGEATCAKIDLAKLQQLAGNAGVVNTRPTDAGLEFSVRFTSVGFALRATIPIIRQREVRAYTPAALASARYGAGTPRALYSARLQRLASSRQYEGELSESTGLVLTQFSHQGITLEALVEPSKHCVQQVAFRGTMSESQRALLEGLCQQIAGKPILEASDHSVIFLEFELRDHSQLRPVPGIVMPENAEAMFALPTALVRGLLLDYRRQTNYRSIENYYDYPVTEFWRNLTPADRVQKIRAVIEASPMGEGVHVERLETPKRVVIGFRNDFDGRLKQERLMRLEDELKRQIELTLQLFVEPKVDENKIRRLKEADTL